MSAPYPTHGSSGKKYKTTASLTIQGQIHME